MICPHIGLSKMLNTKKQLYLTSLFETCDTTEAIHAIHSNLLPHLEGGKNKILGCKNCKMLLKLMINAI